MQTHYFFQPPSLFFGGKDSTCWLICFNFRLQSMRPAFYLMLRYQRRAWHRPMQTALPALEQSRQRHQLNAEPRNGSSEVRKKEKPGKRWPRHGVGLPNQPKVNISRLSGLDWRDVHIRTGFSPFFPLRLNMRNDSHNLDLTADLGPWRRRWIQREFWILIRSWLKNFTPKKG